MTFIYYFRNFLYKFTLFSIISLLTIIVGKPIYGTTDDNTLSGFISGSFTGEQEKRLIFIRPLMGEIFYYIQKIIPTVDIYSWFLLILVIFSSSIISVLLTAKNVNVKINFLFMILIFPFIFWFTLLPNYTSASMVLSLFGFLSVILIFSLGIESKFLLISSMMITFTGYLIRPEGFFGVVVLLLPLVIYIFLINKKYKQIKKYHLLFFILTSVVVVIIDLLIFNSTFSEWQVYDSWNSLRHQIQHRNSQDYLIQMVENGNWSVPEYHLFMDLAFGDPKIFNFNWLNLAFQKTEFARSLSFIFDYLSFRELYLDLFSLISKYFGLIILEIIVILLFIKVIKINLKHKIIILLVSFGTAIASIIYLLIFLHAPDRTIFIIVLLPIFILLSIIKILDLSINQFNKTLSSGFILLGLFLYLIQPVSFLNQNKINSILKEQDLKNLSELMKFNKDAIYIGPGHSELFDTRNPYLEKSIPTIPKLLIAGNWETFSPHWYKRAIYLGIKQVSVFEALLQPNTYYIGFYQPDTAYLIELYLMENGYKNIYREQILEIKNGINVFRYGINE